MFNVTLQSPWLKSLHCFRFTAVNNRVSCMLRFSRSDQDIPLDQLPSLQCSRPMQRDSLARMTEKTGV
jgi:hypothetical protein